MSASGDATDRRQITRLLVAWKEQGDEAAGEELFSVLEPELRRIAAAVLRRETGLNHKIQPTELVSELYLRLANYDITIENRRLFLALVAKVMRHAVLDLARRDRAAKRPPSRMRVETAEPARAGGRTRSCDVTDFYMLLDRLRALHSRHAQTFEYSCMLGLSAEEISDHLSVSVPTVKRDLRAARAWFKTQL